MKKKIITIIAVVIISISTALTVVMIALVFLSGKINVNIANGKCTPENTEKYMHGGNRPNDDYPIKANVFLDNHIVNIREEIEVNSHSTKILLYLPSANSADTIIGKILPDRGSVVKSTQKDTMLEIDFSTVPNKISIEYEIILQENRNILSYSSSSAYLGDFLATPAVYESGIPVETYRSAYGDPFIYETKNYEVMFSVDSSMDVYAPGEKEAHVIGSNKLTVFRAKNLRDFSAVIVKKADVKTIQHGNINMHFIHSINSMKAVEAAFDYAERMIGPYPYKDFFVVKMPLFHEGMEFSNMIFLADSCFSDSETLKRVSYHEVFHQWFYGIIGTDQLNEPFLDEGLASYLSSLLAGNAVQGKSTLSFLKMPLKNYTSRQEYYYKAYDDSALYFSGLHQQMGSGFFKVLQKAYSEYKFKIMHFDGLKKIISEISASQNELQQKSY